MSRVNQILKIFNFRLMQEFYVVIEGETHLCFISEEGLWEEVDNDWIISNEILSKLIFSECLVIPKYKPKKGTRYYYLKYDLDDVGNPDRLEILSSIFEGVNDVARYSIGNCFSSPTEAEFCGSYVAKEINKIWEGL